MGDEPRWHERILMRLCPTLRGIVEQAQIERAEAVNQVLDQYQVIEDLRAVARDRGNALRAALRVHGAEAAKAFIAAGEGADEHKAGAMDSIEWYRPDGIVSVGGTT